MSDQVLTSVSVHSPSLSHSSIGSFSQWVTAYLLFTHVIYGSPHPLPLQPLIFHYLSRWRAGPTGCPRRPAPHGCHRSILGWESGSSSSYLNTRSLNLPCAIAAASGAGSCAESPSGSQPTWLGSALARMQKKKKEKKTRLFRLSSSCALQPSAAVNLCTKRRSEPLLSPILQFLSVSRALPLSLSLLSLYFFPHSSSYK